MKLLGYTYPDGYALCLEHGTEQGSSGPIYDIDEAHLDVVCDEPGCGIILERNCCDGCGTAGEYAHFLYYDDRAETQRAHDSIMKTFGNAEWYAAPGSGYACAVLFTTEEEFSVEQAEKLVQTLSPDEYDLNNPVNGDEDEETWEEKNELGGFPEVFTERERDSAVERLEDELTLEYIARLERIAYAAYVFYVKSYNLSVKLPGSSYDIARLPVEDLAKALYEALSTVNFMR